MLKGPTKQKYDPTIRSFALTLSFYSPRAYNFVRNTFNRSLPHLSTLSKWYQSIDGTPGFTKEALVALKLKSQDAASCGKQILCNLVFDEMAIRRQVEWTGTKFTGHVDIGTKLENDILPVAKEALVFMLVPLNGSWKIPVAYFLLDGLAGSAKADLVKKCLEFVHESGVTVTSLTFDGAAANFTMAKHLGADFNDPQHLKTYFIHPLTSDKIFIFLDPCHMLKLIRNCFGSQKILKDIGEKDIMWEFLSKLVTLQTEEGLHAATKLRLRHLQWTKEKMRVKLATQTLSKSVADALLYLQNDANHPDFQNVDATATFLQNFNDLFDIFNSRNRLAKYMYKKPLSPSTENSFFSFLNKMVEYILGLKVARVPALNCPRKTGFLGFLICIESLKNMYQIYVKEKKILKFMLTYKLSQDHLELFFGAIRSKGGHNNNPTARHFEAAYKRLIVRSEISGPNTGNAINLDNIPILYCGSGGITLDDEGQDLEQSEEYKAFQDNIKKKIQEHNYIDSKLWDLTIYVKDIVSYVSGFVVRSLKKCVTCLKCLNLLESNISLSKLQTNKQYGNLIKASTLVVEVCQTGEKYFRFFNKTTNIFNKNVKDILAQLMSNTMRYLPVSVYEYFGDHLYEDTPIDGHSSILIKLILKNYFNIRIHHESRKTLENIKQGRVRNLLNKTIIFKGQ